MPAVQHIPAGVDLSVHAVDVRRIFRRYFAALAIAWGYDPDDVLGEIYLGIITRNRGRSAWDPTRGRSLSGYIYLVCQSVLRNYRRKHSRWEAQHQIGVRGRDTDGGEFVDVAEADLRGDGSADERLYLCERMEELAESVGATGVRYLRVASRRNRRSARAAAGLSADAALAVDACLREWAGIAPLQQSTTAKAVAG